MNEIVKNELQNIMMFDQYNSVNSQLNIINKCNKLLSNDDFCKEYIATLDCYFNRQNLQIVDLPQIILGMQRNVISHFGDVLNLYHTIQPEDMKYILYGLLYDYIMKFHPDFIDGKLVEFRLEFNNVFELIMTSKKQFKVKNKIFTRFFHWLCCCTAMKTKESEPIK